MRKIIVVVTFISAFLIGCAVDGKDGFGSLRISVVENQSRTISSDVSKEVSRYVINGAGPEGISPVTMDVTSGEVTIDTLYPGEWIFTVDAYNANDQKIGTGSTTVTIEVDVTSNTTVEVYDLEGDGTLDLSISWTATEIQLAEISATLTDDDGSVHVLDFTITDGVATYNSNWASGLYRLDISLDDGEFSTISTTEEVFIFPEATSTGTFNFDKINKIVGSVSLSISNKMRDVIDLSISGLPDEGVIYYETTLDIVNNSTGTSPTYEWFVNGTSAGTGTSLTIDPNTNIGYCYISVIAEDSTNNRAGSISELTEIRTYQVGDIGPSGGYIIYDDEADEVDNIEGFRYIEVSELDITGTKRWGSWNPTVVTGAESSAVGSGAQNTIDIIEQDPIENKAADFCADYIVDKNGFIYDDWFLPSTNELKLAYNVLHLNELGNFVRNHYYTSTRGGSTAQTVLFSNGQVWNHNTSNGNYVRPFRYF